MKRAAFYILIPVLLSTLFLGVTVDNKSSDSHFQNDSSFIKFELSDNDVIATRFLIGYRVDLAKNGVSLVNQKNGCIGEAFHLDKNGLIIKTSAVYNFYGKNEYSTSGLILKRLTCDHSKKHPLWGTSFEYNTSNELIKKIEFRYDNNGLIESDSIISKFTKPLYQEYPGLKHRDSISGLKDSYGRITSHVMSDLNFPCGIKLKGECNISYFYATNGLIDSLKITDSIGECRLVFRYEYEYDNK